MKASTPHHGYTRTPASSTHSRRAASTALARVHAPRRQPVARPASFTSRTGPSGAPRAKQTPGRARAAARVRRRGAVLLHEVARQRRAAEPDVAERAVRRRWAVWVRLVVELQAAPQGIAAEAAEAARVAAQSAAAGEDGRHRAQCTGDCGARWRHHHRASIEAVESCPNVGCERLAVHDGARWQRCAAGSSCTLPAVAGRRQCRLSEGCAGSPRAAHCCRASLTVAATTGCSEASSAAAHVCPAA
jgi:hypothetical protein